MWDGRPEAQRVAEMADDVKAGGPVGLVSASGQPIRRDTRCPQCQAEKTKRVPSASFGTDIHDVCGVCGYEFGERTV